MIQEPVLFQEINILYIDPPVLDHLEIHIDQLITLVLHIVIAAENVILIELHHEQDTLNFIINEEILDLLTTLPSEIIAFVLFPHLTPETDTTLEFIILFVNFHQYHVLDLSLHLENVFIIQNQIFLKIMTTTLETFPGRKKFGIIRYDLEMTNAITPTS